MSEIGSSKRREGKTRRGERSKNTHENKGGKMEKQIEAYLKVSFEKLLVDKEILKQRPDDFSIDDAVEKIGQTFEKNMKSDREAYLRELILRLSNTYQECIDIKSKYDEAKHNAGISAVDVSKENQRLQEEIASLETKYARLKEEQRTKKQEYKRNINDKKKALTGISSSIDEIQAMNQALVKGVDGLKSSVLKIRGGQSRMLKQVKAMILNEVEKVVSSSQEKEKEMHDCKLQRLDAAISAEKAEQRKLQRQCQTALDSIYSIVPNGVEYTRITVDDLPARIEDVKDVISKSIDSRKTQAIEKMKEEVSRAIPGIEITNENIIDSINRDLEEKLKQKEEECKRIIKKGEERERILKERLEEALVQIKELQEGPGGNLDIINDVEKQKSIWEENRDKLDAKMSALSLGPI